MIRSTVGKVIWVGKVTVFLVGLAMILALVLGMASAALGANGQNFILGQLNKATAITQLNGNVAGGPALRVNNTNTAAGSRALQLGVAQGKSPLTVNSDAGKATNLNADRLDDVDSTQILRSTTPVYENSRRTTGNGGANQRSQIFISCDAGDLLLNGGVFLIDRGSFLEGSGPSSTIKETYAVILVNDATADEVLVKAVCADFPPLQN